MITIYKFLIKIFIVIPIMIICGFLKSIIVFLLSDSTFYLVINFNIIEYVFDKNYRELINNEGGED